MPAASRVNPTEFAILGLLAEEARSGYDIKKEVEERLSSFWSESYGHIYPMLRRLQRRKLVAVRKVERQRGRPARSVYAITPAGRRALKAWFDEPPSASRPRNELLLRIFLGRHAPPGALLRDVTAYGERAAAALAQLRAVKRAMNDEKPGPDTVYWNLAITFGVALFETIEEWSATAVRELRRQQP